MTIRSALGHSVLRFAIAAGIPAALVALPSTASAQEWLRDRKYAEGAGIKVGDLELHPGIGGEVGYDSNYFLRTSRSGFENSNPDSAVIFRVTPSFFVSSATPQRLEDNTGAPVTPPAITFRGGAAATLGIFIGDSDINKQTNVAGNVNARVDILPSRPVGFGVFAGYQRLIQPQVTGNPDLSFNRDDINAGAEAIFLPGGGTLDMRAGYQLYADLFEQQNGVPFTNVQHEISFRDRWRFRPRTALFSETSLRFVDYPDASRSVNYLNDSTPLRTQFGITGLLTDRFGALLAAGYGATFFKDPAAPSSIQYDSFNGQAEGTFYLSSAGGTNEPGQATLLLSTFSLGAVRDFQLSFLSNYYTSDKLYAKIVYFFGGKVLLTGEGYFEFLEYPEIFSNGGGAAGAVGGAPTAVPGTENGFTDYRVGGKFFGEYRLTDSFGINLTLDYAQMISNTSIPEGGVTVPGAPINPASSYDLAWQRFQAFIGARYFL